MGYSNYVSITTVFEPNPTCFAPSNLWTSSMLCSVKYGGVVPRADATFDPSSLICPLTLLGPPTTSALHTGDSSCYAAANTEWPKRTVFSDCPVGLTPAVERTHDWGNGVTSMYTDCCPSAYEFAWTTRPIPLTVGDSVYSVELYGGFRCRASAIKELSGQTITLTVSTEPLITTEATYEGEFIFAQGEGAGKIVYEASGTTSTCFGGCPDLPTNPLQAPTPSPTPAPTGSYVPPPSHPTTQFTPAPSCLGDSNLWLVSTSCQILEGGGMERPSWLECAITENGEPDVSNTECYVRHSSTMGDDGTTSFYAGCPAGYTTASETTFRPFDEATYGLGTREPKSYDVVASYAMCCPEGDYSFQYSDVLTTTTTYDFRQQLVDMYPMPRCVATSVQALSGRDVELTLTDDQQVWDKKRRQEETAGPAVTTRPWDYESGLLFAQVVEAKVTVFHGTYSCLDGCSDYFTYSYNNTDPNYTPTSTASSTGETTQASGATSSLGNTSFGKYRATAPLAVALFTALYRTVA